MKTLNKYGFKPGDRVRLDATFRNGSIVTIVNIWMVFATVRAEDSGIEWDTMINRLTPLEMPKLSWFRRACNRLKRISLKK